jgi:hypothetical protein
MDFNSFTEKYDKPESVVLLLGKRKVLKEDEKKITELGRKLATLTQYIKFRSGNADGSDELFANAIAEINIKIIQVIKPFKNHRKKTVNQYETISLDTINILNEPDILYYSKQDRKNKNLIVRYEEGYKDQSAMKGAYLLRDTMMVVGAKSLNLKRADFAIFYDDLIKPEMGGTGFTIKVCKSLDIPYINQSVWFKWLDSN